MVEKNTIPTGNLIICCVEAELTRDTAALAKMDPFVKFFLHENSFITPVCTNGGKNPKWNKHFDI